MNIINYKNILIISIAILLCIIFISCNKSEKKTDAVDVVNTVIEHTVSSNIRLDDNKELTFILHGLITKEADFFYGEDDIEINISNINKITVIDNNGNIFQEITDIKTEHNYYSNPSSEDDYGFYIDDWNFDGYQDISLFKYMGGSMGNFPHYYWLWNNDEQKFIKNDELEWISENGSITIDPVNKFIISYSRAGLTYYNEYYIYENGSFMYAGSVSYEFNSEDDSCKITVFKWTDNEQVVFNEYFDDTESLDDLIVRDIIQLINSQ